MSPRSLAFWADDRIVWIGLGVFGIIAAVTTTAQLRAFKKRCEVKPEARKDSINQATEDAIKLETLAILARSVNYDLRNAALKILSERATSGQSYEYILSNLYNPDVEARHKALRILIYLSSSAPIEPITRLCTLPTFRALVSALLTSLHDPPASSTERDLFRILSRLMQFNRDLPIQAGIIEWFKRRPDVISAYFEPTKFAQLDVNLIVIIALLLHDTRDGKSVFEKAKLLPDKEVMENYQSRAWQQHHAILAVNEITRQSGVPTQAVSS